jgi:hypothetical protein
MPGSLTVFAQARANPQYMRFLTVPPASGAVQHIAHLSVPAPY